MSDQPLLQHTEDGVRTLTLNRPARRNALNAAGWVALTQALDDAMDDRSVRVVVLTGAGKAFCSGQDLSEMTALPDPDVPHPCGQCRDALCRFD